MKTIHQKMIERGIEIGQIPEKPLTTADFNNLKAVNAELLKALKEIATLTRHHLGGMCEKTHKIALEAIKKAES